MVADVRIARLWGLIDTDFMLFCLYGGATLIIMDVMKLGDHIRQRRKELGISLLELSSLAGCSAPYLSTIETNKVNPPAKDILLCIEKALEFQKGELVEMAYIEKMPSQLKEIITAYKLENARLRCLIEH